MKNKIIAIAGNARTGKDTVAAAMVNLLEGRGLYADRFAFGDAVKEELYDLACDQLGISVYTEDPREKKVLRELLVWWGQFRKREFSPSYWIDIVDQQMQGYDERIVFVVSDMRFIDEYDRMKQMGAEMVYLKRKVIYSDGHEGVLDIGAANSDEAENNPKLEKLIGNTIVLPNFEGDKQGIALQTEKFLDGLRHRWDPTRVA